MQRISETVTAETAPRVLFCSWTELDIASGTPVIICDLLQHFSAGHAEALVEENRDNQRRRQIRVEHPIRKYRFHSRLWPYTVGHRIRSRLARLGTPVLIAQMIRRIRQLRPDCILAVYAQPHWILATWIASRLTGVPLLYYVHDTFLEQTTRRKNSAFARWLDRKALSAARVLVLHPYLADYYRQRYGIECTVLRQIIRHPALPARDLDVAAKELVIGFSGAIYDNNSRQLAELARIIERNPWLRLKIWSDAAPEDLARKGIAGERIETSYETNYERLLSHLAGCDLLYLPLAFFDTPGVTTHSLQYAFPTKSLDYLVCGTPILVHCPKEFELSQFFSGHNCGYVVNESGPEAIAAWLDRWLAGEIAALDDAARLNTLDVFSPEANKRLLWQIIAEETKSSNALYRNVTDHQAETEAKTVA
jgi:glycosyltransferase involved in cell wall biosynthesis